MNAEAELYIIAGTTQERGYAMVKLRRDIIALIQEIENLETLNIIYQFIRGIKNSRK